MARATLLALNKRIDISARAEFRFCLTVRQVRVTLRVYSPTFAY